LQRRFPSSRIVHIYASTEAGTGFAVQDGRAGFPNNWIDNLANVPALRISNDNHLLIKPPLLANGEAIASRLDTDGFLDTQDLVRMEGDRVYFLGRSTGAINVVGNKVNPEEVEACLRRVGGVLDARVFAKTSSIMGQLVAAEIIAVSGQEPKLLRQQIQQFCRAELEPWQIPALLSFVDALKETTAGKRERVSQ
jgi:acyl-CoA synthetase (AMP-forming)/AMP-acid ligase II